MKYGIYNYEEFVQTVLSPPSKIDLIGTAQAGLSGEIGELLEAMIENNDDNVIKELGDVLFYVAVGCLAVDCCFASLSLQDVKEEITIDDMAAVQINVSKFADHVKKVKYQGKLLDKKLQMETLVKIVNGLTKQVCEKHGKITIQQAIDTNVEKLQARYPNGFEVKNSENRVVA